jgi:hypothetical protein
MDIGCLGKEFHLPQVDDEVDDVGLEVEISRDIGIVIRVPREAMSLSPSVAFEYSGDEMLNCFDQIQGRRGAILV